MSGLAGKRILLLEDEILIQMMAEEILKDLGAVVVGPAATVAEGLVLARSERLDAAVLDINMNGERSFSVADLLQDRGVPVIFASGYGSLEWAGRMPAQIVDKPYTEQKLAAALSAVFAS